MPAGWAENIQEGGRPRIGITISTISILLPLLRRTQYLIAFLSSAPLTASGGPFFIRGVRSSYHCTALHCTAMEKNAPGVLTNLIIRVLEYSMSGVMMCVHVE
jgi:hypothetical protein